MHNQHYRSLIDTMKSLSPAARTLKPLRRPSNTCRKPLRIVPYIRTFVQYDGTFGAPDQGQTLDVWESQTAESGLRNKWIRINPRRDPTLIPQGIPLWIPQGIPLWIPQGIPLRSHTESHVDPTGNPTSIPAGIPLDHTSIPSGFRTFPVII
jgi:hypothetical protein